MSRLDSVIRRLEAQRACLDAASSLVADQGGVVLELGLGNGRTYDHLRDRLPDKDIYVFEREVNAHPDCIPPEDRLFLGDLRDTIPAAIEKLGQCAVMVHSDIGTGDNERNRAFAAWLGAAIMPLLKPGAILISDQEFIDFAKWQIPLPDGVQPGRYFTYRIGGE